MHPDTAATAAEYQPLFSVPLLVADLPDADALITGLAQVIAARREMHATQARSNMGGWQSDTGMLQWGGEAARALGIQMVQMCNRFTRDLGQTDPNQPRFEWSAEMWANVCPPGVGHEAHAHPGSLWSAVFYVDDGLGPGEAPEAAGYLVLEDPKHPMPMMYKPDLCYLEADGSAYRPIRRFTPRVGRIVAFPAWLSHWVTPHQGLRERVSIAMNTLALPARQR
jgi:uncharacterized protein (TIGR02466 family)